MRAAKDDRLRLAYRAAEAIMKERAVSFYQAFSRLPKDRFHGVAAIYAFCRYSDDTVDAADVPRNFMLRKLDLLEQRLHDLYPEDPIEHPTRDPAVCHGAIDSWWPAFADTVQRWQIPRDGFLLQIEGQRQDADFKGMVTVEDLVDYSRLVAGSVGIMMLPVLAGDDSDPKDPLFQKACSDLGVAMQITNILRDVGEDLRTRQRIYLPSTLMAEHGVSVSELEKLAAFPQGSDISPLIPTGFIRLFEELSDLADGHYRACEPWMRHFHPASQVPLRASALIYQAIADAVRQAGYNCFTRRCYTDHRTRAGLLLKATALRGS